MECWRKCQKCRNCQKCPQKIRTTNVGHSFNLSILYPKNTRTRKNFEAFFIANMKPSHNKQVESNVLNLLYKCVT